jgi:hypothetical protein
VLKVERRLEVVKCLEVIQDPREELWVASARAARAVEINQLASKNNIPTIIDIFPYLLFI